MNTREYKCKYCHTTDPLMFYPSTPRYCKVCKNPKNREAQITSLNRMVDSKILYLKCLTCEKELPKDNYDISVSGLLYDKCKKCRIETRKKIIHNPRYEQLSEWVNNNYSSISKEDAAMLSNIFHKLSL